MTKIYDHKIYDTDNFIYPVIIPSSSKSQTVSEVINYRIVRPLSFLMSLSPDDEIIDDEIYKIYSFFDPDRKHMAHVIDVLIKQRGYELPRGCGKTTAILYMMMWELELGQNGNDYLLLTSSVQEVQRIKELFTKLLNYNKICHEFRQASEINPTYQENINMACPTASSIDTHFYANNKQILITTLDSRNRNDRHNFFRAWIDISKYDISEKQKFTTTNWMEDEKGRRIAYQNHILSCLIENKTLVYR